jgi:hypothetical protein
MTSLDAALRQAYRETRYEVPADPPVILSIGAASAPLRALHRRFGVECSAFVSACNPFSRRLDAAGNAARHRALLQALVAEGRRFLEGAGRHPSNGWPAEPSVLVFGLSLEESRALGRRCEQNALVWCGADAVPALILLR